MSDNIDIKIREDGSRVVSRNLDDIANKAAKADKAIDTLNKTVSESGNAGAAVEKLRALVRMAENYGNGIVKGVDQTTRSYRNSLMKHFEDISKQARASSASIKSSMEVLTNVPIDSESPTAYYRQMRELDNRYTLYLAGELSKREAADIASANARFASATKEIAKRTTAEQSYTQLWANMLATRDKMEQDSIIGSVKTLQIQETAERKANATRLQTASQVLTTKAQAEQAYTAMWSSMLQAREQLEMDSVVASVKNLQIQEAAEQKSFALRLKNATAAIATKQAAELAYTGWWEAQLAERNKLEQVFIANAVKNMLTMEAAEKKSNADRLASALSTVSNRQKAEAEYTAWWISEIKKRELAQATSAMRNAEQRSGMQAFNAQRMERNLIAPAAGTSATAKLYAADDVGNLGQKTALETSKFQAMQRQVAMMQLMLPMAERQLMLDNEAEAATKRLSNAKGELTNHHGKLGQAARTSGDSQGYWNKQANEAHALTRGLSGSLGQLWLTYGSILPLLAGAALGSAFVGAAKAGSELAYSLQFVKSLGGESQEAIDKLKNSTLELSKASQYGPVEIADGYRILAQAGLKATDSLKAMPDVLSLATTGEMTMEQAGLSLIGVMNAFNLPIEQSAHVTDVFAKAAAVSQTSVVQMTEAMKTASTVGTQYHQSMEGTATALALLAKLNIFGTAAGTSYRNMLKELFTPTSAVAAEMKRLGIATQETVIDKFGKSEVKVRNFADVVDDLRTRMSKMNEAAQMKLTGFIGGERGSKELVAMLNLSKEQWDQFYDEIANKSEGFAKKVADDLNATSKGQWKIALNNMQVQLTEAFGAMEPQFLQLATKLKDIFGSEEFKNAVVNVVTLLLNITTTLVDLAPVIYECAKAWLVFKAATVTAAVVQALAVAFTTVSTAISGAGMLMATFSAVAAGTATTLAGGSGVVAALGLCVTPLGWILGLLAAGAAAWLLWGNNAETAAGKAAKSAKDRLAQLKAENSKIGQGTPSALDKDRATLAEQEATLKKNEELLAKGQSAAGKMQGRAAAYEGMGVSALKKTNAELREAIENQKELIKYEEGREKIAKDLVEAHSIKDPWMKKPEHRVTGPETWNPPKAPAKVHDKASMGKLDGDDNALAKLEARLQASEKEYAVIMLTGQAQYQLNEGQAKSLELQQKMTELLSKDISELGPKGLQGRNDQLASLKSQLEVAGKLDKQLQAIELLKVNSKIDEEVRLAQILPVEREKETRWIAVRNELLRAGNTLSETDIAQLKAKIDAQIELNKVISARDNLLNGGDSKRYKDLDSQAAGENLAKATSDWTENDTNRTAMNKLSGMGIDTSLMQEQINTQLESLRVYYGEIERLKADGWISDQTYANAKMQLDVKTNEVRLSNMYSFFGSLATLQNSSNKKLGAIGKAAAITQATMDGVNAVQKAYAGSPYPWNIAAAAAQGAIAAANVAKIAGLQFATGGSFVVGGTGGTDSQNVAFRASPGEKVSVATPTQVRHGTESGNKNGSGSNGSNMNVRMINVIDPAMVGDFLGTPEGEQVLVNTIRNNSSAIKQVISNG